MSTRPEPLQLIRPSAGYARVKPVKPSARQSRRVQGPRRDDPVGELCPRDVRHVERANRSEIPSALGCQIVHGLKTCDIHFTMNATISAESLCPEIPALPSEMGLAPVDLTLREKQRPVQLQLSHAPHHLLTVLSTRHLCAKSHRQSIVELLRGQTLNGMRGCAIVKHHT